MLHIIHKLFDPASNAADTDAIIRWNGTGSLVSLILNARFRAARRAAREASLLENQSENDDLDKRGFAVRPPRKRKRTIPR